MRLMPAQQPSLRIARLGEIRIWPHNVLRIDRVDDIGRHHDQQFGFLPEIVMRTEQRAQHGEIHQARQTDDGLLAL